MRYRCKTNRKLKTWGGRYQILRTGIDIARKRRCCRSTGDVSTTMERYVFLRFGIIFLLFTFPSLRIIEYFMQIYFVLEFPFVHNHVNANRNKANTLSFCQAVTLRHSDGKRIKCVGYENTLYGVPYSIWSTACAANEEHTKWICELLLLLFVSRH